MIASDSCKISSYLSTTYKSSTLAHIFIVFPYSPKALLTRLTSSPFAINGTAKKSI
jgi:hypothetical protein